MNEEKMFLADNSVKKIIQIFDLFDNYQDIEIALSEFFVRLNDPSNPYFDEYKNYSLEEISKTKMKKYKKIKTGIFKSIPYKVEILPEVTFFDKAPQGVMIWLFMFAKPGIFRKKLFNVDVFALKDKLVI